MSQSGEDFDPFAGSPQRAPAQVLQLNIPPATASAEPAPSPMPTPERVAQQDPAQKLCADLLGMLNLSSSASALQQMHFGEWQQRFQDSLRAAIELGGTAAADFYVCLLQSLKAHGIDPQQASAILSPLSRQVTSAGQVFTAEPPQAPPVFSPSAPVPTPAPTPTPQPTPPGELAPPGGVIVAPAEQPASNKTLWSVVALVVLGGGIVAWYYTQQKD